ncbi:hypothetical protein DFJ58DRAFT_423886 [Suillus subalutaceus]|uniref:uncharacterized protein n=1 Tax=Suillus subalutaceus TaxID=48586 RepID=UPI001B85CB07|nr:uncharacterized protein DFJ58DRAFT_423886 [Suillus subalutaceus]KAG1851450.1 hypothetical protein DFJ58DRAFT_423886 [Suillus subalutaceus]
MNQQNNSDSGLTRLNDQRRGFIVDACLSIVGTTWTELERATRADEFHRLGERLLNRIIITVASCTILSTTVILTTPGDPSDALVVGKFFTGFGVISGVLNYARLRAVMSSRGALCDLSQSRVFTRFFMQQIFAYISCVVACSLTLANLYTTLCYTAQSWEIVFPILLGFAAVFYVMLDLTS